MASAPERRAPGRSERLAPRRPARPVLPGRELPAPGVRGQPQWGAPRVRELRHGDIGEVVRIHALHKGSFERAYWRGVFGRFLDPDLPAGVPAAGRAQELRVEKPRRTHPGSAASRRAGPRGPLRIGLAAEAERGLAGYLLGEVRAFEFGSEPCGWVFAVGVDPRAARKGVASSLLSAAAARFRAHGVPRIRTMVRRNDVPVLAFFRGNGFRGGPFVQLELDLEEVQP